MKGRHMLALICAAETVKIGLLAAILAGLALG